MRRDGKLSDAGGNQRNMKYGRDQMKIAVDVEVQTLHRDPPHRVVAVTSFTSSDEH